MSDIAWITCRVPPEPDPDELPALAALRAAGLSVEPLAWDDPGARDPGGFGLCVPRSCWNYYEDPQAFAAFVERVAQRSRLLNAPAVLRWNLHKGYLRGLAAGDVPIVPTWFLERGALADLPAECAARGWGELVVKPAISAGSFCTHRFGADAWPLAQEFLGLALAERDMLVQEFVPAVRTSGERCLVWIDGAFTHAVLKQPRFVGDEEQVGAALPLSDDERAFGEAVLARAMAAGGFDADQLLYARVDTVELRGQRVVSELELLEPSLFLLQSPLAMQRFVRALAARVG